MIWEKPFVVATAGLPDAERTEVECCPTVLLLHMQPHHLTAAAEQHTLPAASETAADGQTSRTPATAFVASQVAVATLPIHGRYPRPVAASPIGKGSNVTFWRSLVSPVTAIQLAFPLVAFRCSNHSDWKLISGDYGGGVGTINAHQQQDVLVLVLPAGSLGHLPLVQYCTAAAYVVAAAVVVFASLR